MKWERIPQQEHRKVAARATITYAKKSARHWDRRVQQQPNSTYSPLTIRAIATHPQQATKKFSGFPRRHYTVKCLSAWPRLLRERSWRK
ncbi:hypothetical protein H6S82_27455 [Planktothrix sp. FACHB-1355]|uniref:Uncharacterized protein n=1 Tax=Aerosakkonema funiforme FACHB-1375 TaxID=2949571 RepID=A0A926VMJ9_9CYAN|nr:hypothetical protein [Planktothrix sp. FACHB-1355]MBD2185592.1 hypothetical protein [Aerosakkonema funiforme FACHB-1375]MBD3562552.1 hypothetical protein [Planktothrix sp. FACHB-1355]